MAAAIWVSLSGCEASFLFSYSWRNIFSLTVAVVSEIRFAPMPPSELLLLDWQAYE